MKITKNAYAKINLTLEILGKRGDDFHDIASVMHKIPLCDVVTVDTFGDVKNSVTLTCSENVCEEKDNIAYKAAEKYLEASSKNTGKFYKVHIDIKKNIPAGAGLAGGSTDGAAVLDALYEIVGGVDRAKVSEIALALGSDVPFCLEGKMCAYCTGRGEIMMALPPIKDASLSVIYPCEHLSTKGIYGEYDKENSSDYTKSNSAKMAELLINGADVSEIAKYMCNDFEPLCMARCDGIGKAKEILSEEGMYAQMSGSGSAVFGIGKTGAAFGKAPENSKRFDFETINI